MVLGCDRDSSDLADVFDENNSAVKTAISQAIKGAHKFNRVAGLCGQAPSDKPEFAAFLVEQGIDSISLTPDSVMKAIQIVAEAEKNLGKAAESDGDVVDLYREIVSETTSDVPAVEEKDIALPTDEDVMELYKEVSEYIHDEDSEVDEKSDSADEEIGKSLGLFNV